MAKMGFQFYLEIKNEINKEIHQKCGCSRYSYVHMAKMWEFLKV